MRFAAKLRLLGTIFLVAFTLVILKLAYIQIISAESLAAAADDEHFYSLEIPAGRGEILSADGFPLVANKDDYLFYVNLSKFTDNKELVADKLAAILATDVPLIPTGSGEITPQDRENFLKDTQKSIASDLLAKFNIKNAIWVNLSHFVGQNTKDQINKLNIAGLGFESEPSRDYPEASMAAHLLGFVGFDAVGNPKGYFGLEGYYERELAGKAGEVRIEKDAFGRPIAVGTETRRDKQDGRDLVTTIDRSVQRFVETDLLKGIKDWKASGGLAIVMDPKTGAILADASFPQYDPANFSYYPAKLYKNPAVADLFEPGSIFKPLVMAAAINENKLTPNTTCDKCDGPRKIGTDYIHTFDDKYHPNETMTDVLVNSDNTGMTFVGEKLGFDKLYSYIQKYGFGQKTGIDLQEEEGGFLRPKANYYEIDKATLTFGQGIGVNAMQMMKAWSVLANNGRMSTPHLVSKIIDGNKTIDLSWPQSEQIISPATAKTVTEMLVHVARESPEHFPIDREKALADFKIAAKSGTAQIAAGGKYIDTGYNASLMGYYPADNPRFLVIVKLDQPEVRIWGSDTAGPVFAAIARDLLYYYSVAP
ncbi:penicillin-binding protein 2 [Patescibacteria group bacterium]|nr:penicillin-binding protein 2 [Patescibacteria group bacterium]